MSFLRPGVYQFLNQLSTFAEVIVFTAGDPEYASPLVACLDPEGRNVTASLYRESTVKTIFHDHVKDLSKLGRDPRYTVLVDNNPFSFLFQPDNGVLCEPFYGDPTDQHLTQVLLPMLRILACVNDVRPLLRRRSANSCSHAHPFASLSVCVLLQIQLSRMVQFASVETDGCTPAASTSAPAAAADLLDKTAISDRGNYRIRLKSVRFWKCVCRSLFFTRASPHDYYSMFSETRVHLFFPSTHFSPAIVSELKKGSFFFWFWEQAGCET